MKAVNHQCHGQRVPLVAQPRVGHCYYCKAKRAFDFIVEGVLTYWRCPSCLHIWGSRPS